MFLSYDRQWRVTVVELDGHQRLRVECKVPVATQDGPGRSYATVRSIDGWYWVADCAGPGDVAQYVKLDELEEVESER